MVIDFEFQPKKKNQKHRYLIKSQKIFLLFLTFRLSIRSIIKCFVRETEKVSQRNRQIQCESESIANSLEFHDLLAPTSSKSVPWCRSDNMSIHTHVLTRSRSQGCTKIQVFDRDARFIVVIIRTKVGTVFFFDT